MGKQEKPNMNMYKYAYMQYFFADIFLWGKEKENNEN